MFFDDRDCTVTEIFANDFFEILGEDSVERNPCRYALHVSPSVAHDFGRETSYHSQFASAKDILVFTASVRREIEVCGIAIVLVKREGKEESTLYVVCPEF